MQCYSGMLCRLASGDDFHDLVEAGNMKNFANFFGNIRDRKTIPAEHFGLNETKSQEGRRDINDFRKIKNNTDNFDIITFFLKIGRSL